VTVIGHSLGGYVALALANRNYEIISGLGLFHSTSFSDTNEKKLNRERTINFILEYGSKPFIETFVPGLFFSENLPDQKESIQQLIETGLKVDESIIVDYTNAMKNRPDRSAVLYNLNKPRLFIAGDKDMAVPIKDSLTQIGHLEGENTVILEKTGHMGMYEQRKLTYTHIRDFLLRI
jgi:pimeloyl-ACP methyl ester carboxylesterase